MNHLYHDLTSIQNIYTELFDQSLTYDQNFNFNALSNTNYFNDPQDDGCLTHSLKVL